MGLRLGLLAAASAWRSECEIEGLDVQADEGSERGHRKNWAGGFRVFFFLLLLLLFLPPLSVGLVGVGGGGVGVGGGWGGFGVELVGVGVGLGWSLGWSLFCSGPHGVDGGLWVGVEFWSGPHGVGGGVRVEFGVGGSTLPQQKAPGGCLEDTCPLQTPQVPWQRGSEGIPKRGLLFAHRLHWGSGRKCGCHKY